MSHTAERIEIVKLLQDLQHGDEKPGLTTLRVLRAVTNLKAILANQPYANSALSVHQIRTILENYGGFVTDEAVLWFREWQAQPATVPENRETEDNPEYDADAR